MSISDVDMEEALKGSTLDERKAAFLRAMEAAWSDGWYACAEERRKALSQFIPVREPTARTMPKPIYGPGINEAMKE